MTCSSAGRAIGVDAQKCAGSNPVTLIGKNKSLFVGLASFSGVGPIFIRSLIQWSFYFGRKPTFSMADYWRRNSMFKLSEIIKKSDVEKLEMLKKKLKK